MRRALKILADREVSPQTGLLKSTLLQLDSTFSERNYGASSFLDFTEKLAQAGLVQLKHAGRSVMVELTPGFGDDGETTSSLLPPASGGPASGRTEIVADLRTHAPADGGHSTGAGQPVTTGERGNAAGVVQPFRTAASVDMPAQVGDNAEGAKIAGEILGAATNARWPMYLRNVKQILRAGGFDERAYGFSGLMDLLRACQREGTVRLERDRRGGLRVMQGPALVRGVMPAVETGRSRGRQRRPNTGRSRVTGRRDRSRYGREHAGGGRGYDRGAAGTREAATAPDSCSRVRAFGRVRWEHARAGHQAKRGSTASRRRRIGQEKRGQPAPQPFEKNNNRSVGGQELLDFRLQISVRYRLRPSRKSIHSLMSGICEPRPFSYAAAYARASFTSSARV